MNEVRSTDQQAFTRQRVDGLVERMQACWRRIEPGTDDVVLMVEVSACLSEAVHLLGILRPPEPTPDCPHAAPFRYCPVCPVDPCPLGLGVTHG